MSIFSPVNWVPWIPWLGVGYISWDAVSTAFPSPRRYLVGNAYIALYLLASFWQGQVTKNVPEPYLDEIFHIPQAQAYCLGDFHIWDPKLTTPPGLYAFTTLFGNLGGIRSCDISILRFFNTLVLVFTMAYAGDSRALIERAWKRTSKDLPEDVEAASPNTLHTAFNIALFPPLFFFSGLFYTDVLSTCVVLRMYRLFLQRKGTLWLYLAGLLALTMRQTNIFWVAVFMGGLEAVRTIKNIEVVTINERPEHQTWKEIAIFEIQQYSQGNIHDIPLKDASIQDFILCAISIAIALLSHPIIILCRLWPYMALLLSFAGFVFWNGGVVLGDKSNHIATLHLPQLLYLSAFTAFFSFPLLLPPLLTLLSPFISVLIPSLRTSHAHIPKCKLLLTALYILLSLLTTLAVIHYNTIIHPFTLADNRHYVFYVFRYTIRFHPAIRYLLAPVYLLFTHLSYRTLSSASIPTLISDLGPQQKTATRKEEVQKRLHEGDEGPTTSFLLIYILSTALSLITAPLVEPRYFIIPWVIWRLHIPPTTGMQPSSTTSRTSHHSSSSSRKRKAGKKQPFARLGRWFKSYGHRLTAETVWFLVVNVGTGYVFLYRGYEWVQEPGMVQRFMW